MPEHSEDEDLRRFEPALPASRDPFHLAWRAALSRLRLDAHISIREAMPSGIDARRMKDMQIACEPLGPQTVARNLETLKQNLVVLFAEAEDTPVGFLSYCPPASKVDPLIVQVVGIVPEARRRRTGTALLEAACERYPGCDVAFATREENVSAHSLFRGFATQTQRSVRRVRRGVFRDGDLGIERGDGYRVWVLLREPTADDR